MKTTHLAGLALAALGLGLCLALQHTAAQQETETTVTVFAEQPSQPLEADPSRVAAKLLLVRSDWSEVQEPEAVKDALTTLLEGTALPDSYRQNLLSAAPKILFSEQFVSLYDPAELASLIAWLNERGLAKIAGTSTPLPVEQGDDSSRQSEMFIEADVIPISAVEFGPFGGEPPPFVTRQDRWVWRFSSHLPPKADSTANVLEVVASREAKRLDQMAAGVTGTVVVEERTLSPRVNFRFELPVDHAAALHGMSSPTSGRFQGGTDGAFNRHWEPVLIIAPETATLPTSATPQLAKPSSLSKAAATRSVPPTGRQATAQEDGRQLKVFFLENSQAAMVGELIQQVTSGIALAADTRTNSLIVKGGPEELATVEALVQQLDRATPATSQPVVAQSPDASGIVSQKLDESIRSRRGEYRDKELQAARLGETLRSSGLDQQQVGAMQSRLRTLVAEAFDLRQQLQETELKLLTQRVRVLEAQLRHRAALREQVIQQRLLQLTTEPTATPAVPNAARYGATPMVPGLSADVALPPAAGLPQPVPYPSTLQASPNVPAPGMSLPLEPIREPPGSDAKSRSLRSHLGSDPLASRFLDRPLTQPRHPEQPQPSPIPTFGGPTDLAGWTLALEQFRASAQEAQSMSMGRPRRQVIRDQFAAQIRLLELEMQSQQAALAAAQQQAKRAQTLQDQKAISEEEAAQATLHLDQAKIRLEQMQTLLDLYRKVGDASDLLPETTAPTLSPSSSAPAEIVPPTTR